MNQYYAERYIRRANFATGNYPRLLWINLLKNPSAQARSQKIPGFLRFA